MIIKTTRGERINCGSRPEYSLTFPYSKGPYNKWNKEEQHIRISEGCPNCCVYCAESWENGTNPIYHDIPEIVRNRVSILDMNLMYKPDCIKIIYELGRRRVNGRPVKYQLQCGIDWRYMTPEKAVALKRNRFSHIRFAWDYGYSDVFKVRDCLTMLTKAGYKEKNIQIFILCNWKIPFYECEAKLLSCIHWGVQVSDCWFDNQLPPDIKPVYWKADEIKQFRRMCRNHNIMIRQYGIQTEWVKPQEKDQRTFEEVLCKPHPFG